MAVPTFHWGVACGSLTALRLLLLVSLLPPAQPAMMNLESNEAAWKAVIEDYDKNQI